MNNNDLNKIYQLHQEIFYPQSAGGSVNIGDDEDDDFIDDVDDDVIPAKPSPEISKKKPTITLQELGKIQEGVISQISEVFSLHLEIAELLLKVHDFKKDDFT